MRFTIFGRLFIMIVYGKTRVINGYEFYVIEYPGDPVEPEKTEKG